MTNSADDGNDSFATLVDRARGGGRNARQELVRAIQDRVYGLALRMLGDPSEAEDATQEILIKVITRLDNFRAESRFTTWVYAVAANHIRTVRAGRWKSNHSFEQMRERDEVVLPGARRPDIEREILNREMRLMCLHGLLVCLDRNHRLAFVLGETLQLTAVEAAQIMSIPPATYRKRLSRARARMRDFMSTQYGMVRPANRCRRNLRCEPALRAGLADANHPKLAGHPASDDPQEELDERIEELGERIEGLDELKRLKLLFRSLPEHRTPDTVVDELTRFMKAEEDAASLA